MCKIKTEILQNPVLLLYGVEPYLIEYYKKALEKDLSCPDMNVNTVSIFDEAAVAFLSEYPFADDRRVLYLQVKTLKDLSDSDFFMSYLKDPVAGSNLVVMPEKVDQRLKIYKQLEKTGAVLRCDKASKKQVDSVLFQIIRKSCVQIKEDAYERFLEIENYEEMEEVTLFDLQHDLEKLCALSMKTDGVITRSLVDETLKAKVKADVFSLLRLILAKDIAGLNAQRDVITEPIGALSALLREYRIAYKASIGIPKEQIGARMITLHLPPKTLLFGMSVLMSAINGIKDGSLKPEAAFSYATKRLV